VLAADVKLFHADNNRAIDMKPPAYGILAAPENSDVSFKD
jgi:hypothetical protein